MFFFFPLPKYFHNHMYQNINPQIIILLKKKKK